MKAVIFDMDGVLFDTERLAVKCWDTIGEELSLGKVGYMVLKTLGRTKEESVKIFEREFGHRFNNDEFQRLYKEYLDNYYSKNSVPLKEGVREILEYLKENGYKIAVASSSSRESVLHHLRDADIEKYFDKIICGDMVYKSKPEPDIYITAATELGVNCENCYAVEDSESGLLSAHRANMEVVYIPDLYVATPPIKKIVDLEFDTLTAFMNYLKEK